MEGARKTGTSVASVLAVVGGAGWGLVALLILAQAIDAPLVSTRDQIAEYLLIILPGFAGAFWLTRTGLRAWQPDSGIRTRRLVLGILLGFLWVFGPALLTVGVRW
jgi:hypothetical protein